MADENNDLLDNLHGEKKDPARCWELVAEGDWLVGQRFKVNDHTVLGRDSSCDITIPGTHLSRRHVELAIKGPKLLIRDLGSSNGTYVNEKKVMESDLVPGDLVRFDVLRFRVEGPQEEVKDINATMIRQAPKVPIKKADPKPAPPPKNWKTKPTSVGNRQQTVQMSAVKKASGALWTVVAITTAVIALVAIGYMVTQL